MINVTKTWLPPFEEYAAILKRAWDSGWVTNNGSLLLELEAKLKDHLGVEHLLVCSNGTIVLQMALKALGITKEVITTPFSYVATVNAILWEGCQPVFVDINPDRFCIDAEKIEAAITENTQAILATHVYGLPCDVDAIAKIAAKYQLKVIYDGAHAFGCNYKGKSLLSFGDISTCSFHATKVFHTVEGGAIICENETLYKQLYLYRQFGHIYDDYVSVGINAKNSELHAAMGLCLLPRMETFLSKRKELFQVYEKELGTINGFDTGVIKEFQYNYSYFPLVFETEQQLLKTRGALAGGGIFCRRYFYPSLNRLPQVSHVIMAHSDTISERVLCLPLYYGLEQEEIKNITVVIKRSLDE